MKIDKWSAVNVLSTLAVLALCVALLIVLMLGSGCRTYKASVAAGAKHNALPDLCPLDVELELNGWKVGVNLALWRFTDSANEASATVAPDAVGGQYKMTIEKETDHEETDAVPVDAGPVQ